MIWNMLLRVSGGSRGKEGRLESTAEDLDLISDDVITNNSIYDKAMIEEVGNQGMISLYTSS